MVQFQANDTYFLDSGDKIRFFFEANAFDFDGNLQFKKEECLNKVGHSLHWHDPVFRKVSRTIINWQVVSCPDNVNDFALLYNRWLSVTR